MLRVGVRLEVFQARKLSKFSDTSSCRETRLVNLKPEDVRKSHLNPDASKVKNSLQLPSSSFQFPGLYYEPLVIRGCC